MTEFRSERCWIECHRQGATIPILFLHGYPLDSRLWSDAIDFFRHERTVIAVDFYGFGKSLGSDAVEMKSLNDEYSIARLADDAADALVTCGIGQPVVVCGLSMGGYVAFEFWRRHRHRLAALILCDTRAAADSAEGVQQRLAIAERARRETTETLVSPMLERLLAAETRERSLQTVAKLSEMMRSVPPSTIALAQRAMAARADFRPWLSAIDVPTLLVVGRSDAITTPDEMERFGAEIPQSTLAIIEGAGHLPPMENPADFHQALDRFLRHL